MRQSSERCSILLLLCAATIAAASPACLRHAHRGCEACIYKQVAVEGKKRTVTECTSCRTQEGWVLRPGTNTCDCKAGYHLNGTQAEVSTICKQCQKPQYCPGGHPIDNPNSSAMDCKSGLASMFNGAQSEAACLTLPGFGRKVVRLPNGKLSYAADTCPLGTFNGGGNSAGCISCNAGLSTNGQGKSSSKDCVAPPGFYMASQSVGRPCPKGTYTNSYNNSPQCLKCSKGTTTAKEGSTSCDIWMK